MTREQENTEIVRQGFAAFQRGDIQGFLELLDDDVDFVTPCQLLSGHGQGTGVDARV
jgi:ketosteroid isomerase-like protein